MTLTSRSAGPIALAAFAAGVAVRLGFLGYATPDVELYLEPWFRYAAEHGWSALAVAFTNYAPSYTYLLVAAAHLDGLAAPLTLVKAISYPFELGSALLAARLVGTVDPRPERRALAFAAVWLAPSVLHNGAFWGQCDAVWTFFLLLALLCFCRGGWGRGAVAFAAAVAVKLQAVFLGPLVLGLALRRALHPGWLLAVPAVYVVLAVPVLVAGRPLVEVLLLYLDQAGVYRSLSKGAANLYLLVPDAPYGAGVAIGLAAAALAGLALAARVGRAARLPPEHLLLAAAVSLALMPFLLPKMHDRFFYPFEIVAIVLACIRPFLAPVALVAQVTSMLCYLPFDGRGDIAQPVTGIAMLVVVLYLATLLGRALDGRFGPGGAISGDRAEFVRPSAAVWFAFAIHMLVFEVALASPGGPGFWPRLPADPVGLTAYLLLLVLVVVALSRAGRPERPAPAG